jgi:fibronectin type 3 domain-containing protein
LCATATSHAQTFNDVPPNYWAFSFIEELAASGVTGGCGGGNYCPEDPVTRAQMAVFLERGMRGSDYVPPPASGTLFADVAANAFAANFIEQLFLDGITSGCGGGNYCPDDEVTRAQMAVFLLRAKYGANLLPPPATGVFLDVNPGDFAANFIEQLAAEGITGGCGGGNYCPNDSITRAQMAVFLVRAFNIGREPPLPPANLSAAPGNASVTLDWAGVAGATGYRVYRSTTSGTGYVQIADVGAPGMTDIGLVNGTTYFYVVTAYDEVLESDFSQEVAAIPRAPLAVPTNLGATGLDARVDLEWTSVGGATGYRVYRSTTSGAGYAQIADVNTTVYVDNTAQNGTTYYYVVTAYDALQESGFSAQAAATPQPRPATPTITDVIIQDSLVGLGWSLVPEATEYRIYRSTTSGTGYRRVGVVADEEFVDTNVVNGVTYFYRVAAYDGVQESLFSNEVSATPVARPAPPTITSATGLDARVELTWTSVPRATQYRVYRSTSAGTVGIRVANTTATSFADVSVANGVTYFYRVRSFDGLQESLDSAVVSVTPQRNPSIVPTILLPLLLGD